ncbi:hypothetical protein [Paracoccus mutanolyticus]|uniref:hypothetical protein n=1 Tax=Paracoccus mutanolyticus TaxID=1499308 RepID=UPI001CB8AE22|nr:hypothetical protein [Paracoccus mutanolyticus]
MAGIGHDLNAVKKHVGPGGMETLFKIANLGAGVIRDRVARYRIDARRDLTDKGPLQKHYSCVFF